MVSPLLVRRSLKPPSRRRHPWLGGNHRGNLIVSTRGDSMNGSIAALLGAGGVYIGGGALFVILLIIVVWMLMRRA